MTRSRPTPRNPRGNQDVAIRSEVVASGVHRTEIHEAIEIEEMLQCERRAIVKRPHHARSGRRAIVAEKKASPSRSDRRARLAEVVVAARLVRMRRVRTSNGMPRLARGPMRVRDEGLVLASLALQNPEQRIAVSVSNAANVETLTSAPTKLSAVIEAIATTEVSAVIEASAVIEVSAVIEASAVIEVSAVIAASAAIEASAVTERSGYGAIGERQAEGRPTGCRVAEEACA
jgi:hypothetical protein